MPEVRDAFVTEPTGLDEARSLETWNWLLSPAVFLMPSERGFSGTAWMRGNTAEFELEGFDVPSRPLPWERADDFGVARSIVPPLDPGPAMSWSALPGPALNPRIAEMPFPYRSQVRVLAGLRGRVLVGGSNIGVAPDAAMAMARPAVVRVTIDASGGLSAPPVIWESSEAPAVDEAAVKVARKLVFSPLQSGDRVETGLVSIEWGMVPPGDSSRPAANSRKEGGP